jgi:alpha-tubulin suppressor-like RCC1 family protein
MGPRAGIAAMAAWVCCLAMLDGCKGSPSGTGPPDSTTHVSWKAVTAGRAHYCGLIDSAAFCWGANYSGSVGDSTTTAREAGVHVLHAPPFVQISSGEDFNCGLTSQGTVACWGDNFVFQLGSSLGGEFHSAIPLQTNLRFVALTTGGAHTCGLVSDGTVYCWGGSDALGPAHGGDTWVPQLFSGFPRFTSIKAGYRHTCGETANGEVYCWGSNVDGQLGIGQKGVGQDSTPAPVISSVPLGHIAPAFLHSCALDPNGAAYCWGDNRWGGLGTGDTISHFQAVPVIGNLSFVSLAASGSGTCGLTADGVVYCWGTEGTTVELAPVIVPTALRFVSLTANISTPQPVAGWPSIICGLTVAGRGYCWRGVRGTVTGPSVLPDTTQ